VVLVLLGPADEDPAVAVQPRVTGLDDPPAGFPFRVSGLEVDLFPASADVWLQALGEHQLADVGVVIAAVKAQALWLLVGGDRPRERDRGESGL
jgi:hypothetical protein